MNDKTTEQQIAGDPYDGLGDDLRKWLNNELDRTHPYVYGHGDQYDGAENDQIGKERLLFIRGFTTCFHKLHSLPPSPDCQETDDEKTQRKLAQWYLRQLRECQQELRQLKAAHSPVGEAGAIPSIKENPDGFHRRYVVAKSSGEPVDPKAEYIVLRLDWGGKDKEHIRAGRVAAMAYAAAIQHHLPKVAEDLKNRYNDYGQWEANPSRAGEPKRIIPEGSYFVAQCEKCGFKGESSEWKGGGQIADTGDYGDSYCPICGQVDVPEADDDIYIDQCELFMTKIGQLGNRISELEWELYESKTERAGEISPALGPDLAKTIQWMKKAGIKNGENCETSLLESYYEGYVAALDELYKEMECPTPAPEVKEERKCDNCQKPEGDQALVEHDEDKWCLDCMRISGYCVSCDCKIKEKVEDYFDYDSDLCPDCENAPPEPVKDTPVEHVGFYCHDKDHGVSEEKCISQCEDCGGEQRVPDPKGEIPEDIKSWMIEWSREEYEIVYDDDAHAMQIEKWRLIVRGAMKAMYRKMQERVDAAKALMGKAYDDKHALRGQIATLTQQNESLIASAEGWEGKYHRAEGDLQKLIDDLAAKGEEAGEYREAMEKVKSDPNKHPAVRLFIDSVLAKYPSTDAKPTT